jgi:hypothetical protein
VVTGKEFLKILEHAKKNAYAIPAVNCTMSPISNACMEAAMKANAPMIVQFSNGGGYYNVGKGIPNDKEMKAAVAGTIAGALHVRAIAEVRATTRPPPLPASRYTPPPPVVRLEAAVSDGGGAARVGPRHGRDSHSTTGDPTHCPPPV